ncbi:MAG: hypothetical protein WBC71_08515 [Salaquimonas sp.]
MPFLRGLTYIFLLPGDLVRRQLKMTVEEDGGILRSFINMCVWGGLLTGIALHYFA